MLNFNSTETSIPWDDPYWFEEDEIEKPKNIETLNNKKHSLLDTKGDDLQLQLLSVIDEHTEISETISNFIEEELTSIKSDTSKPVSFAGESQFNHNKDNNYDQRNNTLEYDYQTNGDRRNYNEQRNNVNSSWNRNYNQKFNNDFDENRESFSEIANNYTNKENYNNCNFSNSSKNQFERDDCRQNQKNNQDRYSRHVSVNSSTFDNNIKIEIRQNQEIVDLKAVTKYVKETQIMSNDLKLMKVETLVNQETTCCDEKSKVEVTVNLEKVEDNIIVLDTVSKDWIINEENLKDVTIAEEKLFKDIKLENENIEINKNKVDYSVVDKIQNEENLEIKIETPKRPAIPIYNINAVKGKWSNLLDDKTSYKFKSLNQDSNYQRNNRTNHPSNNEKLKMSKNDSSNNNFKNNHKINNGEEDELKGNQNSSVKNNNYRNKDKDSNFNNSKKYDGRVNPVNNIESRSNQKRDIKVNNDSRRQQDNRSDQKVLDNIKDESKFNQLGKSYSNDMEFRNDFNGKDNNFHNNSKINHLVKSNFQNDSKKIVYDIKDNLKSDQIEIDYSDSFHIGKKQHYEVYQCDQEFRSNPVGRNNRSQNDSIRLNNDKNRPINNEFKRHTNNTCNILRDDRVNVSNVDFTRDLETNQINDHGEGYKNKSLIVNKNGKDNVVHSGFEGSQNDLFRRNYNRRENIQNKDFRRSDKRDVVYNDSRKPYDNANNDSRRYYDNKGNTVNIESKNIQNNRDIASNKKYDNMTFVVDNDLRRNENNTGNKDYPKLPNEKLYLQDDKKIVQNVIDIAENSVVITSQNDRVFHNRNYNKFITEETNNYENQNNEYHKSTNNEYSKFQNGNESYHYRIDSRRLVDADHPLKNDNKEPLMENSNVYNNKNISQKTLPESKYDRNNEFRSKPSTNSNTSNNGFSKTNTKKMRKWEKNNENNSNQNNKNFRNQNSNVYDYESERHDEVRKNFRNSRNGNFNGDLSSKKPVHEENSRNIKNYASNQ